MVSLCCGTALSSGSFRSALVVGSALLVLLLVGHAVHGSITKRGTDVVLVAGITRPAVHVAVCFFGLTRSLPFTINSIRTNMFDVLTAAGIQYTTYLHTHNVTNMFNPRAHEFNVTVDPTLYRLLRPDVAAFEQPIDWTQPDNQDLLETLLKHGDPWRQTGDHISLRNLVNQLQSLQALTALWTPHASQFDAVIYLRSDVWFFNPIDVRQLLEAAATTSHPVIWTPVFGTFHGLNDRFAFGNVAAMQLYGNRWQHALAYADSTSLHAEQFLKYAMRTDGVDCRTTNIVFTRVRGDGLVVEMPAVDAGGRLDTTRVEGSYTYHMVRSSFGNWELRRGSKATKGAPVPPPSIGVKSKATAAAAGAKTAPSAVAGVLAASQASCPPGSACANVSSSASPAPLATASPAVGANALVRAPAAAAASVSDNVSANAPATAAARNDVLTYG